MHNYSLKTYKPISTLTALQAELVVGTLKVSDFTKSNKAKLKSDADKAKAKLAAKARRDKLKEENLAQRRLIEEKRLTEPPHDLVGEFTASYYKRLNNVSDRYIVEVRATPKWADREQIEAIHQKRKEMSQSDVQYHVDHVIPLKGKYVSGLNVPSNLRIITKTENILKSNKYEVS